MRSPVNGLRSNCWKSCLSDQGNALLPLSFGQRLETRFAPGFFRFRLSMAAGIIRGRAGLERQRALQAR